MRTLVPGLECREVTAEGDSMYDKAFPVRVEHTSAVNMAVGAGILLKIGRKYFGKFRERSGEAPEQSLIQGWPLPTPFRTASGTSPECRPDRRYRDRSDDDLRHAFLPAALESDQSPSGA